MIINILITLTTFVVMEFVAWFTHRYIMHGLMWFFHEDHHQPTPGVFEKNDLFFLIFATPSALLCIFGSLNGFDFRFFIGIGIALYGMAYFFVHDLIIHQRIKVLQKTNNIYVIAIRRGHASHHKHMGKEHGECFGMLLVPFHFFKEAKEIVDHRKSKLTT